ncbi:hypothetical protein MVEN_00893600 [Mycena venus]|uniref:Uncharacterized protein n=1 Tax=Mycena venus TaxID=2733690 RepID=A0A8H6YHL1_9AGAR|nr:hypothetical protein MVEN_00893600 [Mycena venus]
METNLSLTWDPCLPPELERTIFKVAALSRPSTIPTLMLVANHVKEWVEPLLYRVIILSSYRSDSHHELHGFPIITPAILLRGIATKPSQFFQSSVKNIFIYRGPFESSEIEAILTACNCVTNLFENYALKSTAHLGALGSLKQLRRLSIPLIEFLDCCTLDGTHSSLNNITHLEILNTWEQPRAETICARLPLLSHLTHFAINSISHHLPLQTALRTNTTLQCILFLVSVGYQEEEMRSTDLISDDDRFVCLDQTIDYRLVWLRGVTTGDDFWALADGFIAARRAGKVERSRYTLSDTETSWLD